jgi:ketosteroid isomerase-like protein
MPEGSVRPELVELTREVFDAADRGDVDGALASFAADAVWESQVLERSFEGVPAIKAFMERWLAAYAAFDVQAEDIEDLGGEVALCVFRNRPTDRIREPSLRFALVVVWAEGLVRRVIGSEDVPAARAIARALAAQA